MNKALTIIFTCICLCLPSAQAMACFAHMLGGYQHGMAPPQRVVKLDHPRMARVPVGEETKIVIYYERPLTAKNVKVQLTGVGEVEVLDEELEFSSVNGTVTARFILNEPRVGSLTMKITGEDGTTPISESSAVFLLPQVAAPASAPQVSAR